MKFLLDVNASGSLANWQSDHEHDVMLVEDVDPRMADDKILQWALEEQRIIVTTDRDFEELIWREKIPHSATNCAFFRRRKTQFVTVGIIEGMKAFCGWRICLASNACRYWTMF